MFIGTYEHTIDEKSRLTLPARFREALGAGVVLARGLDGTVAVYPRETWSMTVEARISALDPLSREARELRRFFFSGAPAALAPSAGAGGCVFAFGTGGGGGGFAGCFGPWLMAPILARTAAGLPALDGPRRAD